MKLPDKFQQNATLLLLAILAAYLLSSFVLQPQAATKANLSDVLLKGPSINSHTKIFGVGINEGTDYLPVLIKWLLALLAAFAMIKGYKYWQRVNHRRVSQVSNNPKDISPDVKKYKETLSTISSLKTKSEPPNYIKRKKKRMARKKSTRFSGKQAKKIVDSSLSLSSF